MVDAAQSHAQTLGITVTVAVVDEGGLVKRSTAWTALRR